jgi:outer membrane protein assembly factor BamB
MRTLAALCLLLLVIAGFAAPAAAGDWPQFRGPNRDGISKETGLARTWPEGGPRVLWKAPTGDGYSGMAVAQGRLFTLLGRGGDEVLVALDAKTGKELWKAKVDGKYVSDMGNGPRSTPTVDGEMVYALSASAKLWAFDAKSGKKLWSRDLSSELGARTPTWGVSTSPLIEGNLLLLDVGGSSGKSLAALDKKTGKTVWTSQSDRAGYSAPIAFTVGGVRHVVFFTGTSVVAVSPADGKLLWRVPWRTDWDVNAATPIFIAPDKLYISSGYETGAGLFRIKAAGGKASAQEVWKSKGMKNQFSSSIVAGGVIYGFDNKTLKAIDVASGQERWKERGLGHGSLILADGHLIVLSETGTLVLAEASPAGYKPKATAPVLSGRCWTMPTLANGVLYVRNQDEMLALSVAAPKTAALKP